MDLRTYGGQPFEEEYVSSITEARAARLAEPDRGEFLSLTRALETPSSRAGDDDRMLARLGGLASRADAYDPAPPTAGPGDEPLERNHMPAQSNDGVREQYSPGYGEDLVGSYQERSVGREAAFLRSFLRSGMKLLDCGCGPGSITVGLGQLVSPGEVHGVDVEPSQIAIASARQQEAGVANLRFEVGSVYALSFPDDTFDVVFMHAILQHLREPLAALREARRVLRPGGVVGVRDDDLGSLVLSPTNPDMDRLIEILGRIMQRSGGNPYVGRTHRRLLREAGFSRVRGSASSECDGTPEATTTRGDLGASLLAHMSDDIVAQNWATVAQVERMIAASKAWGRDPDAYDVITWCEAVGWKES